MDWFSFRWIYIVIQAKDFHCDTTFSLSTSRPDPLLKGRPGHGQLYLWGSVCMQYLPIFVIPFFHVIFALTAAMYRATFLVSVFLRICIPFCFNFLPPSLGFMNHLCNNNQPWILTLRGAANEYRRLLLTIVTPKQQKKGYRAKEGTIICILMLHHFTDGCVQRCSIILHVSL